jgi:hypothetical protein
MSEHFENRKNEVALRRFAAVSFIEQKVREGFGCDPSLALGRAASMARRKWPLFVGTHPGRLLVCLEKPMPLTESEPVMLN